MAGQVAWLTRGIMASGRCRFGGPVEMTTHPSHGSEQDGQRSFLPVLAHFSVLVFIVGVPSFAGPLVVWLMSRDRDPAASEAAREALNFAITAFIYAVTLGTAAVVSFFSEALTAFVISLVALGVVFLAALVLPVVAAVRVSAGERYRYPFTIRFV